ncbi:polysaccharide export protein [Klebsiella pneumoniae]|nr:polysaccharide export protein [Klebsiella pneumoniae]
MLVSVDVLSVAGLRVTLLPLFLYGGYIFIKNNYIDKWAFFALTFSVLCLPSLFFSAEFYKSVGYLVWIFFNYIALCVVYKSLIVRSLETVYNHPELTNPQGQYRSAKEAGVLVKNDGTIIFPYVGELKVSGMSVEKIRSTLSERLVKYIEDPQVDVSVARLAP